MYNGRMSCILNPLAALSIALALGCTALIGPAARADVIYSNLSPSGGFNPNTRAVGAGHAVIGTSFIASATGTITSVELPLAPASATGPTIVATVAIFPSTIPNGIGIDEAHPLWQGLNTNISGPAALRSFVSTSNMPVVMNAGQTYVIVLYPTGDVLWNQIYNFLPSIEWYDNNVFGSTWALNPNFTPQTMVSLRILDNSAGPSGACCSNNTGACTVMPTTTCTSLGLRAGAANQSCSTLPCHGCAADFDANGTVSVLDIFAFLNAWFAGCP
jgi:hypothetical protein